MFGRPKDGNCSEGVHERLEATVLDDEKCKLHHGANVENGEDGHPNENGLRLDATDIRLELKAYRESGENNG